MKKKKNKKMPTPSQEFIDNPIHTSLFLIWVPVARYTFTSKMLSFVLKFEYVQYLQRTSYQKETKM